MKTQAATAAPAVEQEQLDDYPSQHITGRSDEAPAFAYELNSLDMRNIFGELRELLDTEGRGDIDGERCQVDYKVFRIEVCRVFDDDGIQFPGLVAKLNHFAQRNL